MKLGVFDASRSSSCPLNRTPSWFRDRATPAKPDGGPLRDLDAREAVAHDAARRPRSREIPVYSNGLSAWLSLQRAVSAYRTMMFSATTVRDQSGY